MNFSALEWGEPQGTPHLLIHGWMDQAAVWLRCAEGLGSRWLLAPDLRGFGQSDHCSPGSTYAFGEYLLDLDALLGQLPGPVVLIGHSMGGTISSLYAGIRPERVRALVLVDGLGMADGVGGTVERWRAHLDGHGTLRRPRLMGTVEEAATRLRLLNPSLDPEHARLLALRGTRLVDGGVEWSVDPRHRLRAAMPYRQDQHRKVLAEIRCPALMLVPETPGFAREDIAFLQAAIPRVTRVEVPGTSHLLQVEAPQAISLAIHLFLQESHEDR